MASGAKLDLRRIEAVLLEVGRKLRELDAGAGTAHDPLDRQAIANMLEGYRYVERLDSERVDLFAPGESAHWLELNCIVLCGMEPRRRAEQAGQVAATERRFYDEPDAGVGDLMDWYRAHDGGNVWDRAAGVYVRILATPQLFIEGNNRTGALVMSHVLMRAGEPPFVLTTQDAVEFFILANAIRELRKNNLWARLRLRRTRKHLAEFLRRLRCEDYVQAPLASARTYDCRDRAQ